MRIYTCMLSPLSWFVNDFAIFSYVSMYRADEKAYFPRYSQHALKYVGMYQDY